MLRSLGSGRQRTNVAILNTYVSMTANPDEAVIWTHSAADCYSLGFC